MEGGDLFIAQLINTETGHIKDALGNCEKEDDVGRQWRIWLLKKLYKSRISSFEPEEQDADG